MSLTFFFIYKHNMFCVCVARALIMPCKVCKTWADGHWSRFLMLYGVGRVLRINRNGALRSHELRPSRFPVWGRVDFWGKFVEWVLLCSEECHNKYIQDPEAIIFESLVNMFLWSSHVWVSRICFHLICAINCDETWPTRKWRGTATSMTQMACAACVKSASDGWRTLNLLCQCSVEETVSGFVKGDCWSIDRFEFPIFQFWGMPTSGNGSSWRCCYALMGATTTSSRGATTISSRIQQKLS